MDSQNSTIEAIGKRLADQRNNFAHGNLNKEFDETSVIDLIFLKYMVYAFQLARFNIGPEKIVDCIERIFRVPKKLAFSDTMRNE